MLVIHGVMNFYVASYSVKYKLHRSQPQLGAVRFERRRARPPSELPRTRLSSLPLCPLSVPLIDKYEVGQREGPLVGTCCLRSAIESMDSYCSYSLIPTVAGHCSDRLSVKKKCS